MEYIITEQSATYPYSVATVYSAVLSMVPTVKGLKLRKSDGLTHRVEVGTNKFWAAITSTELADGKTTVHIDLSTLSGIGHLAALFAAISAKFHVVREYKNQSEFDKDSVSMTSMSYVLESDSRDKKGKGSVTWVRRPETPAPTPTPPQTPRRTLTPDGQFVWDGSGWQPVPVPLPPPPTLSADGRYVWDGSRWQAVGDEILNEIRRLTDMRDHGHLNQREYDEKRVELLARL